MDSIFWILLVVFMIAIFCLCLYIYMQRKVIEWYRNWIRSIVHNGNILIESLSTIAAAYGYSSMDELVEAIERDRNAKGKKK